MNNDLTIRHILKERKLDKQELFYVSWCGLIFKNGVEPSFEYNKNKPCCLKCLDKMQMV